MTPNLNLADQTYVKEQYRASNQLEARIALHERFSIAKQKWFAWYFDHLDLPANAHILEIGCGTGMLWRENRARIPASWRLTLSDFSFGMLETTRAANVAADFLQSDAQAIPFREYYFDAVFANHMLYHVPDIPRALMEIRRVLKPSGKFYAATNGPAHMREYFQMASDFLGVGSLGPFEQFRLDNGAEQIGKAFARVERFDYEDALVVTEVEPLVAYAMSGFIGSQLIGAERETALRQFIAERIARDGAFHITKSTGLFIATG
jgi:ubiquinone/menaquinone biosynthesis C-methylase UbiE